MTKSTRKTNSQRRSDRKRKQEESNYEEPLSYDFTFTKSDDNIGTVTPDCIPIDIWMNHILSPPLITNHDIKALRRTSRGFLSLVSVIPFGNGLSSDKLVRVKVFSDTRKRAFCKWPTLSPPSIKVRCKFQGDIKPFISDRLQELKFDVNEKGSITIAFILDVLYTIRNAKCSRLYTVKLGGGTFPIGCIDLEVMRALPPYLKRLRFNWSGRETIDNLIGAVPRSVRVLTIGRYRMGGTSYSDMYRKILHYDGVSELKGPSFPNNLNRLKMVGSFPDQKYDADLSGKRALWFSNIIWKNIPHTLQHLTLKDLIVSDKELLVMLKSTTQLLSLHIIMCHYLTKEVSHYLPSTLKSLSIISCVKIKFDSGFNFPKGLIDLSIEHTVRDAYNIYPQNLKRLFISNMDDSDFCNIFKRLPKSLERLKVEDIYCNRTHCSSVMLDTHCLKNLPPLLKVLDIHIHMIPDEIYDFIDLFPKSLEYIVCNRSNSGYHKELPFVHLKGTTLDHNHHFFCPIYCPFSSLDLA